MPICEKFNTNTFTLIGRSSSTSTQSALRYLIVKDGLPKATIDVFKGKLHSSCKIINASLTKEFDLNTGTWVDLTNREIVINEIVEIKSRKE